MTRRIAVRLAGPVWLALLLIASSDAADATVPNLSPEIPIAERNRLTGLAAGAAIATRVDGEPFLARRDVFEYLLNHLAFTTHVTQALRFARLRIWPTAEGLMIDEGWGTTGRLWVVYAADGTRVLYMRGQHQMALLPSIHGEMLLIIDYHYVPGAQGRDLVKTAVAGFVKLDSRILSGVLKLGSAIAQKKADREARGIVKLFAKVSRAVEEDPAGVYAKLRDRQDVPRAELEEFRALLALR
jgi:hypothetical protein